MLQKYLNANLIPITDEGDFKKLKKTSAVFTNKLPKNKTKIESFTLSAIDPDVSPDNPDIVEVKEALIKNWNTFLTNAKDTPITYIRAVMLEALSGISNNLDCALVIWFSGRNIVRYNTLNGNEKDVVLSFFYELGKSINLHAVDLWSLAKPSEQQVYDLGIRDVGRYAINDDTLRKYLEDAVGPYNREGKANFESPNQYFPNSGPEWSYEFPARATKGLKSVIDLSLKAIVAVVNDNNKAIQDGLQRFTKTEVNDNAKSLSLRSELLWWKEARYSSSLDRGYDEIDNVLLPIALANDYSVLVPDVYPRSVDYFLRETYRGLSGNADVDLKIEDFLKLVQQESEKLKVILPYQEKIGGKSSLLNFINGIVWGKIQLDSLKEQVGMGLDIIMKWGELTNWLFQDFQLLKIQKNK